MEKSMIIRTIVLTIALLNQVLVTFGWSPLPFDEVAIEQGLTAVFTTVVVLWNWYRNNDTTKEAKAGTEYMRQLKAEKKASKK